MIAMFAFTIIIGLIFLFSPLCIERKKHFIGYITLAGGFLVWTWLSCYYDYSRSDYNGITIDYIMEMISALWSGLFISGFILKFSVNYVKNITSMGRASKTGLAMTIIFTICFFILLSFLAIYFSAEALQWVLRLAAPKGD